jgi:hypothetical protein
MITAQLILTAARQLLRDQEQSRELQPREQKETEKLAIASYFQELMNTHPDILLKMFKTNPNYEG